MSAESRIAHYYDLIKSRSALAKPARVDKARTKKPSRGRSLTVQQLKTSKTLAERGWTNERIAEKYGVSIGQVQAVCRGIKRGHKDGR